MRSDPPSEDRVAVAWRLLLALGLAKLALHVPLGARYGYFRDELYFLDCGRHLDWGYVDHAPLIGLVARLALLLGGSLPALRILPAVAGAALVVLAGVLAARLGGRSFAQGVAALAVLLAPIYLATDSILSMNAFEPLFWMGGVYALLRILQGAGPRHWIAFGLLAGLGLENKHSTAFFGFAVLVALLLSPQRRLLRTAWPWVAGGVAFLLFLPNLVWQYQHAFATLEDLRNVSRMGKNVVLGPLEFLAQQVVILHPVLLPLWLAGLGFLFFGKRGRWRLFGWIYLVLLVTLFLLKAKNYYLAPSYPMLFAGGAVALEGCLVRWPSPWPRRCVVATLLATGLATAPLALPLLEPEAYLAYQKALGIAPPKTEVAHRGPLPQLFGDQFGWQELVAEVARIYASLPAEERTRTAIFANNYGEAGAVNLFGPKLGLPTALSAHQSYFLWGPRGFQGDTLIVLQDDRESLAKICASVEEAGTHFHPWGMAEENNPIFVCRGLKPPLEEMWPALKHWN